jgi:hypothetical protein
MRLSRSDQRTAISDQEAQVTATDVFVLQRASGELTCFGGNVMKIVVYAGIVTVTMWYTARSTPNFKSL